MNSQITFFNVEHGDSFLIQSPTNKIGIIDCCKFQKKIPVLDFIVNSDIKEIDFICLTHHHKDHYTGLLEILNYCSEKKIPIKNYIDCGVTPRELDIDFINYCDRDYFTKLFLKIKELAQNDQIHMKQASEGTILYSETGMTIKALAPFSETLREIIREKAENMELELNERLNSFSIVLLIDCTSAKCLLLSDAERKAQSTIANRNKELASAINLLKISHHGSIHSYYPKLVRSLISPNSIAVISTGCKSNTPHVKVITDLKNHGAMVYSTNYIDPTVASNSDSIPESVSDSLFAALIALTTAATPGRKLMPYHGNIRAELEASSIKIETEYQHGPI